MPTGWRSTCTLGGEPRRWVSEKKERRGGGAHSLPSAFLPSSDTPKTPVRTQRQLTYHQARVVDNALARVTQADQEVHRLAGTHGLRGLHLHQGAAHGGRVHLGDGGTQEAGEEEGDGPHWFRCFCLVHLVQVDRLVGGWVGV
jgi:hypothetical protein